MDIRIDDLPVKEPVRKVKCEIFADHAEHDVRYEHRLAGKRFVREGVLYLKVCHSH